MLPRLILSAVLSASISTAAVAADEITDGQIIHIAYTAGQLDISQAGQALIKSQNSDVVDFAILMARDHKAGNDVALKLMQKEQIGPEDNETSQALVQRVVAEAGRLSQLSGEEFDKGYIQNEINYHQTVIASIQDKLLPAAKNPELKEFLSQGLPLFQAHLAQAEKIARKLAGEEEQAEGEAPAAEAAPAQ